LFDLPPQAAEVAAEVAGLAAMPATRQERAEALLAPLRRVIPFQAVRIALLDPQRRQHALLTCHGYDDRLRAYMTTRADYDEIESFGVHGSGTPRRLEDLPVPLAEIFSWTELFQPAGFREGLGVGLITSDGRTVGMLALNTDDLAHPTRAACNLVRVLAPTIADAVDPLRSLTVLARIIRGVVAGTVLTNAGEPLPLPGLPTHPLLAADSPVLTAATRHLGPAREYATFLAPCHGPPAENGHVRITLFGCAAQVPRYLQAVVAVAAPGDLSGLTHRELEILGALVEDWADARIAAALDIPEVAVGGHLESIQLKLGVPDRSRVTLRALREGLYVPVELTDLRR
jgi:DNA-binding CsgD family transcriptional regulator